MNGVLLVVAVVAALNPFRTRLGLPEGPFGRARWTPLLVGLPLGTVSLVALAWVSGPLLTVLEVSPETFLIAAGLVAGLAGGWALGFRRPAAEPELDGWWAGLWPVAYPRIMRPEAMGLAIAAGSMNGVAATGGAVVLGVALLGVLGAVPRGPVSSATLAWLGRVMAATLVVVGVWLMIEGIREV